MIASGVRLRLRLTDKTSVVSGVQYVGKYISRTSPYSHYPHAISMVKFGRYGSKFKEVAD